MKYDVYRLKVNEDDDTGMKAMSLVDKPAIESDFLKFKKQESVVVALKDEKGSYKQVVAGLALIPDKMIYRKNGDYEYFVFFQADDIETIRNKFHKEKLTDVVNLQHTDEKIQSYLVESYILNTQERVDEVKAQGIEEAVLGSWYVQYKIEDKEVFEQALEQNLNGFSIEVKGDLVEIELNKNNNNKNNLTIMSKFNKLINKFKEVLNEFEEVTAKIADTETTVMYGDVGEPVYKIVEEEGVGETKEVMAEGEYVLDNGITIVVDDNGNLGEMKEEEAPADPIDDNELEDEKLEKATGIIDETEVEVTYTEVGEPVLINGQGMSSAQDIVLTDGRVLVVDADGNLSEIKEAEMKEEKMEEKEGEIEETKENPVLALIPKNEDGSITDGSYSVEIYVEKGEVSFGTLYAYTYKDLKFAQEEVEKLKIDVEKLKEEPAATPIRIVKEQTQVQKLSKEDRKKMNNLEYTLKKLNIE